MNPFGLVLVLSACTSPSAQGGDVPTMAGPGSNPQPPAPHAPASTGLSITTSRPLFQAVPAVLARTEGKVVCAHPVLQTWDAQWATQRGPEQRVASSNNLFSWHDWPVYCQCLYCLSCTLLSEATQNSLGKQKVLLCGRTKKAREPKLPLSQTP